MKINNDLLVPNPHQPRPYFNDQGHKKLEDSLGTASQLAPIWVIRGDTPDIPEDVEVQPDQFLVMNGRHRLRAFQQNEATEIEVKVLDMSYADAYHQAVVSQAMSQKWNKIEEAEAALRTILHQFQGKDWFRQFGEGPRAVLSCSSHIQNLRSRDTAQRKITEEQEFEFEACIKSLGGSLALVQRWVERYELPPWLQQMVADGDVGVSIAQVLATHSTGVGQQIVDRLNEHPMSVESVTRMAKLVADEDVPGSVKRSLLEGMATPEAMMQMKNAGDLDLLGELLGEAHKIMDKQGVSLKQAVSLLGDKSKEFRELKKRLAQRTRRRKLASFKPRAMEDVLIGQLAERVLEASEYAGIDEVGRILEAEGIVDTMKPLLRKLLERAVKDKGSKAIETLFPDPDELNTKLGRMRAVKRVGWSKSFG